MLDFFIDMVFLAFTGKKRSYYKNKDGTLDKQDIEEIIKEENTDEELSTNNRRKAMMQLIIIIIICALVIMAVHFILPK